MSTATAHNWLRRISDYHSGTASVAERAAVEAHLAECAECRLALAAYQRLYALASSPLRLDRGDASPLAEFSASILEEIPITHDHDIRGTTSWRRPPTTLSALGAIAAVLVIALLAGVLFAHFRPPTQPAAPHPTPTLDAPTRAYVNLLRSYYVPLVDANLPVIVCVAETGVAQPAARAPMMATCRAPLLTELSAARTFAAQIATSDPPASLRSADATLKQAAPQLITFLSGQLADIDAQNVSDFVASEDPGTTALYRFVPPIQTIDTVMYASQTPQAPPLPLMGYVYPR